jgi:acyl phosphate:glycerol-3-phosphate acyltransferase
MNFTVALPPVTMPFAVCFMAFLFGFIPGAIPFGFLAGRMRGIDLRRHGSGNIGFTNVIRVMGWQYGVPVLLLDLAKGLLPVLFLPALVHALADGPRELLLIHNLFGARLELLRVLTGLSAILGHLFTPVLKFKGGKGVATTAGVVLALAPWTFLLCLALFLIILLATRYLSLASMSAAVALPIATALLTRGQWTIFAFTVMVALLILVSHRPNLRRLLAGNEHRFVWRSRRDT